MSVRIVLTNPPEFYTNLDVISGKVILGINRPESIGAVIVKLEGESKTALGLPDAGLQDNYPPQPTVRRRTTVTDNSQIVHENHKVLYKVQQIFPDESVPAYSVPVLFHPGQHEWNFSFRVPFNNACGDPGAMAKIGGLSGAGGFAGPSLFGMGGIRLMDGSKQLYYSHVTKTLPPSFTGFPRQAEIRYYIKATIQRPSLFKENFRHQLGFKFLPIEPPRPPITNQEAYARRPFTFRPKSPGLAGPSGGPLTPPIISRKSSMFSSRKASTTSLTANGNASSSTDQPPSIEISARIPHPPILTCNKPVPLRLIAKKLVDSRAECYLASIQIDLVGTTQVRCQDLVNNEETRWVVTSRSGLAIPLQGGPDDAVGTETEINKSLWDSQPLPNTVMPSFVTCNLKRSYALELKLGVSWGKPPGTTAAISDEIATLSSKTSAMSFKSKSKGKGKSPVPTLAQTIFLPLHFSAVQVYSGLTPPESLIQAASKGRKQQTSSATTQQQQQQQQQQASSSSSSRPRPSQSVPTLPARQEQQHDPLYPPQLQPGQTPVQAGVATPAVAGNSVSSSGGLFEEAPPPTYDEAPPSYDEAMAEVMPGPVVASEGRPAYSGVTNENAPDTLPAKGR
ncbi:unnamed protein product [Discula destructiva]